MKRGTTKCVQEFASQWKTVQLEELWPDADLAKAESMYSQYWYRAVAAMVLSGRVAATYEGRVNKTDGMRLCKEGNFNPAWLDELSWFLVNANVVAANRRKEFVPGDAFAAFDQHDLSPLCSAVCNGVLNLLQQETGNLIRPTRPADAKMIEFLTLYASAFSNVAVRESDLPQIWLGLSQLSEKELLAWSKKLGLTIESHKIQSWRHWLDGKGVVALRNALYQSRWAYYTSYKNGNWFGLSFDARSMLGLVAPLPRQTSPDGIEIDEMGFIKAGGGLPIQTLARLYSLCRPVKVRELLEFQIDKKRLSQFPAERFPAKELRELLGKDVLLSAKVEQLLGGEPSRGGRLRFEYCSGVVIPEDEATAKAIRKHPRLKGYLLPNAPPGILIIKPDSDPSNFIHRCRELGFEVN